MKQRLFTRDFTLLALGQALSLAGNYALRFALSMYVLELTGSAGVFAGMLALAMAPTVLLSPLGGALADRCDRRRLMAGMDAASGLAVLLALPFFRSAGGVLPAGAMLFALSVLGAFESPVVQACLPQLLSGERLLRGNSVVNQIQALAGLVTPFLGGLAYAGLGLGPVLLAAGLCFLLTAGLECFIRLPAPGPRGGGGLLSGLGRDLRESLRFLRREEPGLLRLLLLAAGASFFVSGTAAVGFPHLVRNVLGLSAELYGASESVLGAAAVLGALAAGIFGPRLKRWERLAGAFGLALLPAGAGFAARLGPTALYLLLTCGLFAGQFVCSMFSVLALSHIQQRTPEHLTGKVTALTMTLSTCAQPLGQLLYGQFFDLAGSAPEYVLLPTAAALCLLPRALPTPKPTA